MEAVLCSPTLAMMALWSRPQQLGAPELEMPEARQTPIELALVRSARRGDRQAFARIVDLHKHSVHALASRLVGAADAPDVAQDVFLRAFERLHTFDSRKALRPWLLATAYHRCLDELRRRGRAAAGIAQSGEPPPLPPEHQLEMREQSARVNALLGELPEQQREALLLFHQEALSYRDIAGVMDVPLGTVMTWIHRARRTLRARLEAAP